MTDPRPQLIDAALVAVVASILLALGVAVAVLYQRVEPPCPEDRRATGWSGGRYTVLCLPEGAVDAP